MAEVKETVLIDIDIKQNQADFAKLGQLNGTISNLKQSQKQLNEDFKAGRVPIQQFNVETAKLNSALKITQAEFSKVQRGVTGLKSPFADLKQSIADNAKQVTVAGISYQTFLNPLTLVSAGLGGLFKLYSSSTQGAKDLEFAQSQLSAATNILGNELASLVSFGEGDGDGFFSTISNALLTRLSPAMAAVSKHVAQLREQAEDLGRELLIVQDKNNQRLEENTELIAQAQDSTVEYGDKIVATSQAITNLRDNERDLLFVKEAQLKNLEGQLAADKENEFLQTEVLKKTLEISNIKRDTEKRVQGIVKLESNLLDTENKRVEATQKNKKAIEEETEAIRQQGEVAKLARQLAGEKPTGLGAIGTDPITLKVSATESLTVATENLGKQIEENAKKQKKSDEDFEKGATEKGQLLQSIASATSNVFAEQLKTADDFAKGLLKGFLITSLRALKTFLQFEIIGKSLASAESIETFGLAGILKSALITGILEAAFGAAEGALTGFAVGGRVKDSDGVPVKRSNGDNRLVTVKTDEAILNRDQINRLGGNRALALAGVPGYDPNRTGFATGGFSRPQGLESDLMQSRIFNAVNRLQVAVVIEDVESLSHQRAQIRESATL